jgi:signal transduction histidine kinase
MMVIKFNASSSTNQTLSEAEQARINTYSRERGLRLARLVGRAFGATALLCLFVIGILILLIPGARSASYYVIAGAAAFSVGLNGLALWFVHVRNSVWAALCIVMSLLAPICTIQIEHAHSMGLTPVVMILFSVFILNVALAGVLGNLTIMFFFAAFQSVLAWLVCVVLSTEGFTLNSALAASIATLVILISAFLYFVAAMLYDNLLRELGDIRAAYEQVQRLDEMKDQFITNVNHELRTPLMALYMYIDTLRVAGSEMSATERAPLLDGAIAMGDRMIALVESILDVRRIEQGVPEYTPMAIDVRSAIDNAATMVETEEIVRQRRLFNVTVGAGVYIWGDQTLLQEIISNLLSNAIKYSDAGKPIDISASLVLEPSYRRKHGQKQPPRQMIEIAIRDYGHGIPPDQMPLLFQRFSRLPRDLASNVQGNGLGLYLCRQLADAMHGTIHVESAGIDGDGTTFFVRLPVPPTDSVPSAYVS